MSPASIGPVSASVKLSESTVSSRSFRPDPGTHKLPMMHWVGFTSIVPLPTTVFNNPEVTETAKIESAQAGHAKPSSSQLFRANAAAFANFLEYNLAPPATPARSLNRTKHAP